MNITKPLRPCCMGHVCRAWAQTKTCSGFPSKYYVIAVTKQFQALELIWPNHRYGTFNSVYTRRWKSVLGFRQKSLFTACDLCSLYKEQLASKSLSFDQKLGSLKLYRRHLHDCYCDRSVLWKLESESRDPNTDVLYITTDGLDQAKFALPRFPQHKTTSAMNLC